jgi:hypothetical protein
MHYSIEGRRPREAKIRQEVEVAKAVLSTNNEFIFGAKYRRKMKSVLSYLVGRSNPSPFGSAPRAISRECELLKIILDLRNLPAMLIHDTKWSIARGLLILARVVGCLSSRRVTGVRQ